MKTRILILLALCTGFAARAQFPHESQQFSRADTLRGMLTPLRTCYDINYYHLDVKIDIDAQSVSGSNEFRFTAVNDFKELQFDLFENLKIEKVVYKGTELPYKREANAVFVTFPKTIKKGTHDSFTVWYGGTPKVAKNPPWDGGFIFKTDKNGDPFVSVACQGLGASVWWPNKDHQSDEVDSMLNSIRAPKDLQEISNGRLRSVIPGSDGYTQHNWFVSNPINNYDVSFYIGKYAHWQDTLNGEKGTLTIDYWPLQADSAVARPHWEADTKQMLKAFEYWFGPYPWYEDGYKLVEAPHLGMEHQSAVAYGNQFRKGYSGRDLSRTGVGLKWDFIIVHESGHEWFGNNITSKDVADMWVHEGFTSYSEVLFTEYTLGKQAAIDYVVGIRRNIRNDVPIIGPYNVNREGSGDMYYKGSNMLHTIRTIIKNDDKFREILRGLNSTFYHQTVTTAQIEKYISTTSGIDFSRVFDQYLRQPKPPVLEYKVENNQLRYRWIAADSRFDMPVDVRLGADGFTRLKPTTQWKTVAVTADVTNDNFTVDREFYVLTKKAE